MKTTIIRIVGVGGQGIVLASNLIGEVALAAGLDVKKAEVHGMSQRGGSVTCDVRFGEKVFSPLAAPGEVDLIIAFERLEALLVPFLDLYVDADRVSGAELRDLVLLFLRYELG